MIRINLVPRDEARRMAARRRDKQAAIAILSALGAVILVSEIVTRGEADEVQAEADVYQEQLADLTKKYQETVLLERKRGELESKLNTIAVLERQRRGPVHVLADLGVATPEKLWLTEMSEAGGAAVLSGRGLDNQTVALFMRNLEKSPYFDNVELVETKQVEEGKAKFKEFSIRSSVLYAGNTPPKPAEPEKDGTAATEPAGAKEQS